MNLTPFSYLNLNLNRPLGNQPPLMNLEQLHSLFSNASFKDFFA